MAVISNNRSTVERNEILQKEYWDNRLLEIIKLNSSNYVFVNLGREVTIPKNEGTLTISMRRYNSLPIRSSGTGEDFDALGGEKLSEGTPNTPLKVEAQKVQASVGQFGAWISITDHVQDIHLDDIKTIYQPELADHAAKIRELDVLEQISADASERWVGGEATSNAELVAPGTVDGSGNSLASILTIQELRLAALTMKNYNRMGHPKAQGKPLIVVHSNVMSDLLDDEDLKDRLLNPGQENAPIKIGTLASYMFYGLTVMETLLAETETVPGANGVPTYNVYTSYLLGKDPYVVTKLGTGAIEWKMTGFEASKDDPLGQVSTFGYRMWTGAKVIDPIAITKIYSVSNYDVLVGMDYDHANQASGPSDTFGKVAKQFEGPGFQKLVIVDTDGKGTTTVFNDYKFISEEFNTIKIFLDQDVEFVPGSGAKIITIGGIQFGTFAIDPTAENVLIVTPTNANLYDFVEGSFKFDLAAGLVRNPETLQANPALTYTVNFIDEIPTA
jgi:N4-gp56 family major capsid protein